MNESNTTNDAPTSQARPVRVAINGFGRIGRAFFRQAFDDARLDVVAINDLGDPENLAYLLRYDTAQGYEGYDIEIRDGMMIVDGREIHFISERNPEDLPWHAHAVDVVIESTGVFTRYDKAALHLSAGAKHVLISAPAKGEPKDGIMGATALVGVNTDMIKDCQITSNASCTTNASSPLVGILDQFVGIEAAMLNTVHGYTANQGIVDGPHKKDFRRGRAAAMNIVPTTTGAAKATGKVHTNLSGKFDGIAIRVPVVSGSLADITFIAKRDTTVAEINTLLEQASHTKQWEGIFAVTNEPVVSSDIVGSTYASVADLSMTRVVNKRLVKVLAWYDNEMGYTKTLLEHAVIAGKAAAVK
jgi:glyceraldehyde 3-phosphate dehydrogenase